MKIQVVSFNCILKNKAGQWISSTFSKEVLNCPTDSESMLPGLAKGLQNLVKGEKRSIELHAKEAYGLYQPQKIILFPKSKLPRTLKVGESVIIKDKNGQERSYRVLEFYGDMVSLDGNHPLAGQDLIFEIETLDARDATPEEIDQSMSFVANPLLH